MSEPLNRKPDRSSVPVGLYALVVALVTERTVLYAAPQPIVAAWSAIVVVLITCIVVTVLLLRSLDDKSWLPLLACATVLASILSAEAEVVRGTSFVRSMSTRAPSAWEFVIETNPTLSSYGYSCLARARSDGASSATVRLSCRDCLRRGDTITCVGRYSPGDGQFAADLRMRGVWGSVRVQRVRACRHATGAYGALVAFREGAAEVMLSRVTYARAVSAASVLGSRDALIETGLSDSLSTCGVSHVVAVSGMHITMLGAVVSHMLERTRLGPRGRATALAISTLGYVVVCGAPASALRAWLMTCVSCGSELAGRRSHALSSACVVALVLALVRPGLSGELGYLLSVVSVCSICLFGRYASYAVRSSLPRLTNHSRMPRCFVSSINALLDYSSDTTGVTLAAQVATLPLTAAAFGSVSVVAPLANVIIAPFLPIMLVCGLIAACLCVFPPAACLALVVADATCTAPMHALVWLSKLPLASVPIDVGEGLLCMFVLTGCIGLLIAWPDISPAHMTCSVALIAAAASVALLFWRWFCPTRVCVLDIGQGDAILIQDGGASVLVDAGPDDAILAALARNHVLHLDAVILTHLHDDHYGGLIPLSQRMGCDCVIVAEGVAEHMDGELNEAVASEGIPVVELSYHDAITVGTFSLTMVSPVDKVDGSDNSHSIEFLVEYDSGGRSLSGLLTGDAEFAETSACVARGDVEDIDFLKVGHHGSEVSIDEETARLLDPEVSVASAGEGNSFGHPREECIEVLEDAGSCFLCTIDCGDVEIRPGSNGPHVRCQNGFPAS